jgi:hypothetical protein
MADTITYEWSHPSNIASINSGDSVSFDILVERVEETAPIGIETEPTVERFLISELKFEQIVVDESDFLPEGVVITNNNTNVDITGAVVVPPQFISIAYAAQGVSYNIESVEELPQGARAFELIPDPSPYKYYVWRIWAIDTDNEDLLVQRTFTLTVSIDFDDIQTVIKRVVSEIK